MTRATMSRLRPATAASELAPRTPAGYAQRFNVFERWCRERSLVALPIDSSTLASFLSELAQSMRPATVRNYVGAIRFVQRSHDSSHAIAVGPIVDGIDRVHGCRPTPRTGMTLAQLRFFFDQRPHRLIDIRDRALALMVFSGALKTSELIGLDFHSRGDGAIGLARFEDGALLIEVLKRDGGGARLHRKWLPVGMSPCPVSALKDWIDAAGIRAGPLFRSVHRGARLGQNRLRPGSIAVVVKRAIIAAGQRRGVDYKSCVGLARPHSPKSLRRGFIAAAFDAEVPSAAIAAHVGFKRLNALRSYQLDSFSASRQCLARVLGERANKSGAA